MCEKWRRVDADSLKVWDNRFFFEGQVVQATRLLQRMNAGFHARLKTFVCERHEQQEIFTLAELRAYTLEEEVETEEHGDAMFTFLSVVEFLRQSLTNDVQTIQADDIFLHNKFVEYACRTNVSL